MLSIVAILTLALPAAGSADALRAMERLPLPPAAPVSDVRVDPLERRVVLGAPHGAASLARALARLASAICPEVAVGVREVRLTCRTRRLDAALVLQGRRQALEVRELTGLPPGGEFGFPLVPFDTTALGLGPCPGAGTAARGECLLAAGAIDQARAAFAAAEGDEARGLAALRLGDLALLAGHPREAEAAWSRVTLEPWTGLAASRACETGPCDTASAFRHPGLPPPLADDLAIHQARALAYRGHLVGAAALLADRPSACAADRPLCDRLLLLGLRSDTGDEALALYLRRPVRDEGPLALDLARAAAHRAEAAGAPEFAANLMASITSRVPARDLQVHLLRTARLYLEGDDTVRAGVVAAFARTRAGRKALAGAGWDAVLHALSRRHGAARRPAGSAPAAPELAAAAEVEARARRVLAGGRP